MPEIAVTLSALEKPEKIVYAEILLATGSRAKATLSAGKDLFDDFETQELITHIRQEMKERGLITLEDHLEKLAMIRDQALATSKLSVALSAEVARGKAGGLYVDRTQININALTNSSTEELRQQLQQLQALLGAEVTKAISNGGSSQLPIPEETHFEPGGDSPETDSSAMGVFEKSDEDYSGGIGS